MNVLVIYTHPNPKSLNFALKEAFKKGVKQASHKLQEIDLYADKFNPTLSASELKGKTSPKVKRYQDMIRKADVMVIFYPVWWLAPPAMLEGWFEKVFSVGFAFKYKKITNKIGIPVGLLPCKRAIVVETYGSPGWAGRLYNLDIVWRRVRKLLKYVGIKKITRFPCFSAPYVSKKKREQWLQQVEELAKNIR